MVDNTSWPIHRSARRHQAARGGGESGVRTAVSSMIVKPWLPTWKAPSHGAVDG